jgi:hypothetical protein
MRRFLYLLTAIIVLAFISCNRAKPGLAFGALKGLHFTEVSRKFNTGLTFDKIGYQLEPSWRLYFLSDDSVMVFSPKMKKYYGFHIYFDHDSIFNMVDTWFWLKRLNTDSMVLRSLRVEDKKAKLDDEGSNVYMTFYSERYIKTNPQRNIQKIGLPSSKDTAHIRAKSNLANKIIDSAFSGRVPVVLESNSSLVKVEKVISVSTPWNKLDPSVDYLYPEYNIAIHKAYEDFSYIFTAYVDDKGQIYFKESMIPYSHEFKASYEHVIKGIIDGYLKLYLKVTAGSTLGIAHTSSVLLNVTGKRE